MNPHLLNAKTSDSGSTAAATITRQGALINSSRFSVATRPLFSFLWSPSGLYGTAHMVERLTESPLLTASIIVTAVLEADKGALSLRSCSSSLLAFSSSFRRDPGLFFFGASDSPRLAFST
jgi:hypothetical protein